MVGIGRVKTWRGNTLKKVTKSGSRTENNIGE